MEVVGLSIVAELLSRLLVLPNTRIGGACGCGMDCDDDVAIDIGGVEDFDYMRSLHRAEVLSGKRRRDAGPNASVSTDSGQEEPLMPQAAKRFASGSVERGAGSYLRAASGQAENRLEAAGDDRQYFGYGDERSTSARVRIATAQDGDAHDAVQ